MPPTTVGEVGEGVLPLLLHLHLAHINHERVYARQGRVEKIAAIVEELTRKKTPTPSAPIQLQNHHKIVLLPGLSSFSTCSHWYIGNSGLEKIWTKSGHNIDNFGTLTNIGQILDMNKHWTSTGLTASERIYYWTKFGQVLDNNMSNFCL